MCSIYISWCSKSVFISTSITCIVIPSAAIIVVLEPLISKPLGLDLVHISEKFRYVKLKLYNNVSIAHSMVMATEKASMIEAKLTYK